MRLNYKGFTWIFLVCILFHDLSATAQIKEPEKLSPEQQLETLPHDTSRIRPLFFLANSYMYRDSAKAIHYVKEALELSRKYHRERSECNFLALWGSIEMVQDNFVAGKELLRQEMEMARRINNMELLAQGVGILGTMYTEQGDYPAAIASYVEYLHAAEQLKDTTLIQVGYVNICVTYASEKNYDKAMEYARLTLQLPYKDKPQRVLAVTKALEMIANAHIEKKQYQPARDSLLQALKLYQGQKNENGIATVYTVLANCYPGNAYQQLEYSLLAQQMWERLAPNTGYSLANLGSIGVVYASLARIRSGAVKDTGALTAAVVLNNQETPASRALREASTMSAADLNAKALAYYHLALDRAIVLNNRETIMQVSDSMSHLEAEAGHYKEAYAHLSRFNAVYDSVYSQESKNKIAGIEANYKVELSEKQLQINKLALSDQIKIKWLLISSLVLVLLTLGLIYRQSRLRKKTNMQLDEANKVKTKFFGILNHDLRSPVASLITLLRLGEEEPDLIDEKTVKAKTGKITVAAEELLETMEELLIWSKGQMVQFRPKKKPVAVAELFGDIQRKFTPAGITLQFDQPPALSVITDTDFAKTILRNLTGNAIKALEAVALANKFHQGHIRWKAWVEKGSVWLSITDNGPGATKEQLAPLFDEDTSVGIRSGLGLHIVRDMAKAIDCEIQVSSAAEGGLEIRLKMGAANS